jgi:hypothetical protein
MNLLFYVIPAEVSRGGSFQIVLDSRFHGSDGILDFFEVRLKKIPSVFRAG